MMSYKPQAILVFMVISAASAASNAQNWEEQIIGDRNAAVTMFESGQLLEGATRIINGIHLLPTDDPSLADPVAGNVQLLIFAMEYLMTETQVDTFTTQILDTTSEFDNFIANVYNLQIGQATLGKSITAQHLMSLTKSSNVFVRIGTLFMLCEPYYFPDPAFQQQQRDILVAEFGDLGITQDALLMADLEESEEGSAKSITSLHAEEVARAIASDPNLPEALREPLPVRERARSNFFSQANQALKDVRRPEQRSAALDELGTLATSDGSWRSRYGAIHVIERFHEEGEHQRVYQVLENVSRRGRTTPDVARAEILLVRKGISDWEHGRVPPGGVRQVQRRVDDLLSLQWEDYTLERVLWEDRFKAALDCAKQLEAIGEARAAASIYRKVAAKYPNSQIEVDCQQRIAAISPATVR